MILYPSIHIKDGAVARMTRGGDLLQADTLHPDPAGFAASLEAQGFKWLHVVDLNGAFEGEPVNNPAIEAILQRVQIPVQLSGGMHSLDVIEGWAARGVTRIVLTTAAAQNPALVRDACRLLPQRIAVKIDSRNGFVAATGWAQASAMRALDLALAMEDAGASALIYADINRDGALGEVDIDAMIDLAYALTMPVIASGGVHSLQDLAVLKNYAGAGIEGLILGRSLYNGQLDAAAALQLATRDWQKDFLGS